MPTNIVELNSNTYEIVIGSSVNIGGSAADFTKIVVGLVPGGAVNGINQTFTTPDAFLPTSVRVTVNGLTQLRGTHYITNTSTSIQFTTSPLAGDEVLIDYVKA